MESEHRKCEAKTTSGRRCRLPGIVYRMHDGQEYLVCKMHFKEEVFRPLVKRTVFPVRVIGYLRVSTDGQDTEKNKAEVLHFANERKLGPVEWVEEKVSGIQDYKKRKLGEVLETLKEGDVIITPELSRLGRSTLQVLEVIKRAKEKGIAVHAIKGGWSLNGSIESKVLLTVFAMVAEIERDLLSARTKEGMAARKAAGVKMGRPKGPGKSKLDQYRPEIEALLANGTSKKFVAKRYKCTEATLYNWLDKNKIKIEAKP